MRESPLDEITGGDFTAFRSKHIFREFRHITGHHCMQTCRVTVRIVRHLFDYKSEIAEIVAAHEPEPHRRIGQKALAEDITRRVHGDEGLRCAVAATEALFGGDLDELSVAALADVFWNVRPRRGGAAQ